LKIEHDAPQMFIKSTLWLNLNVYLKKVVSSKKPKPVCD